MSEVKTITLTIDGKQTTVPLGSSIMDAAKSLDIEIPHFCFHKRLSVAGNCRMCLVQVEGGPPKPTASCCFPAGDGMVVHTQSDMVKEARKGVMEFLLINHPLDCPICDQAGECDLQDISVSYGSDQSHYNELKRAVEDKDIGPKIKTVMTRCIHCTRCIRFATEVAGVQEMGATFRGENMSVGTYVESALQSELAGNMIDLCPVGALTSKPYAFTGRNWELIKTPSVDIMDAVGSNIEIHSRAGKVMRVIPRENDIVNEEWISDTARFSYDGLYENRITSPLIKKGKKFTTVGWKKAVETVLPKLKGNKNIVGLAGDLHSVEDLFAFNAFMKQTLESDNIDARMNGFALDGSFRPSYLFNSSIEGIDSADAVILIGSNPRLEAPIINARIRKNVVKRNLPVYMLGSEVDLSYAYKLIGTKPEDLVALNESNSAIFKELKKFEKPMLVIGADTLGRKDALAIYKEVEKLADSIGALSSNWTGLNVLHNKPTAVAALDMNVYPEGKGMDVSKTLKALEKGDVDTLILYGESEYVNAEQLKGAKFTIYIGSHKGGYADIADVVLPVTPYTEKDAWWVNTEGRLQEAKAAVAPLMNAKEDWKVFRHLSGEMDKPLSFNSLDELRTQIVEKHPEYKYLGTLAPAQKWVSIAGKGKVLKKSFEETVNDFYKSNEILRASKVMTECSKSTVNKNNAMRKAG
ncbi:MAG: NADH-quinone oxidoreductase subunit G [Magnetococcales bacterium]|nr:NADH-quinone oxidoreductase subunit G [Magnetococcales bacterium]